MPSPEQMGIPKSEGEDWVAPAERAPIKERKDAGKKENFGTGWKVLAGVEAVGLALAREYFGMGQKRGEAAENRSTGEFLSDVAKTSVDHIKRVSRVLETAEQLTARDRQRAYERYVQDAPDEQSRIARQAELDTFIRDSQRALEDQQAERQGLQSLWEALTGSPEQQTANR